MAETGWRQGGPAQPDTGIGQVLAAYASRGGEILGARRSPDNPLTLTHVRWQDGSGYQLEAVRRPDADSYLSEAERNAWVQLALHFPMVQSTNNVPWLPLTLQPAEAGQLITMLQRSRPNISSTPGYSGPGGGSTQSTGSMNGLGGMGGNNPNYSRQPSTDGPFGVPSRPTQPTQQQGGPSSWSPRDAAPSGPLIPGNRGAVGWPDGADAPEVSAIPCVEIELPPVLAEPSAADAAREFTRDVAAHFKRAALAIPQTREVRGWMRAGRLVLAARLVVAAGMRPPSRSEMEQAAYLLADALARRTLPYTRMTFADPGEWAQGVALPD